MNTYQNKLWHDLMLLVADSETFYYADQTLEDEWYRIFNYRLSSYTEFLLPSALQCRGIMFEITEEGPNATPIRLASLPMEKFFNLYENPMTMDLDLTTINLIEHKADGSLISSYMGRLLQTLRLKSKGSLASTQAIDASDWLKDHAAYHDELTTIAGSGFTVNLEWTAPTNRIVIGYEKPDLRVLNIRNHATGAYYDQYLWNDMPEVQAHWIPSVDLGTDLNPVDFVASIPEMQGIEGYVIRCLEQRVKIKTSWYLALHHTKDSINSPRRLFVAVLEEATDDMKSLFHDDPVAIKMILEMEAFVEEKYNHMADTVERFYERNKHLERKEYAIKGQAELQRMFFGLAMSKFLGRDFSYKEYMIKNWKSYVKDREPKEE